MWFSDSAQRGGSGADGLEGTQISQEMWFSPTWNRSVLHELCWSWSVVAVNTVVSYFLLLTHSLLEEGWGLIRSRKLRFIRLYPRSSEQTRGEGCQWGYLHVVQ